MSGRLEWWLWPLSIAGAVAVHGGLGLALSGVAMEAPTPPPELEVTISRFPMSGEVAAPIAPVSVTAAAAVATAAVSAADVTSAAQAVTLQSVSAAPVTPQTASPTSVASAQPVAPAAPAPVPSTAATPAPTAPSVPSRPPPVSATPIMPVARADVAPASAVATPAIDAAAALPSNDALAVGASTTAPPVASAAQSLSVAPRPAAAATQPTATAATAPPVSPPPVTAPMALAPQPPVAAAAAPAAAPTVDAAATVASPPAAAPGSETPISLASIEPEPIELPPPEDLPETPDLASFLAGFDGGDCFATRIADTATPTVIAYAVNFVDSVALQVALTRDFEDPVEVASYQAEPGQCAALGFISAAQRDAGFPASIALASERLSDGEELSGAVTAPAGSLLRLLLVDDEGRVSDLGQYLDPQGRFAAPVRLTGEGVGRLQLVVALASSQPVKLPPPGDAASYFEALAESASAAGGGHAVAVAAFAIED